MRIGPCPDDLPGAARLRPEVWTTPDRTLVHVSGGWRALVEDGQRITVQGPPGDRALDPHSGVDGPTWLLDGWAVPYALLQQGLLPLHATTVDVDGVTVAIGGPSGVGKSTTALTLAARGHSLLTDDVAAVEVRPDGPWVLPFRRRIHLFAHTAAALGLEASLRPMTGQERKGAVIPADPPTRPRRLAAVVGILLDDAATSVSVEPLHGHGALAWLRESAGRTRSAPATLGAQRYFGLITAIADGASVWRLRRPAEGWTVAEVADAVEAVAAHPVSGRGRRRRRR